MSDTETCVYAGCDQPKGRAFGLCNAHYLRQSRGKPMDTPIRKKGASDSERFWTKVDKSGACWLWTGARTRSYGIFRIDGRNRVAHRVSYEWHYGPIPEGFEVDHMCFSRACVAPTHLRLLDHQANGQNRAAANSNSKSGIRGVYWSEQRNGWMSAGTIGDQITRFGPFPTADEANEAITAWRRDKMPASVRDQQKAV